MKSLLIVLSVCASFFVQAQSEKKPANLYYGYVLGVGTGSVPLFEESNWGISGMLAFEIEMNKYVSGIGYRSVSEFQILGVKSPSNKANSLELLLGRKLVDNKVELSVLTGVSLVTSVVRGAFISSDGSFFSRRKYEKLSINNLGFPISARLFTTKQAHSHLGLEVYANINKYYTFYAINLCLSVKKFPFNKK